jgi:protein kinase-like protein
MTTSDQSLPAELLARVCEVVDSFDAAWQAVAEGATPPRIEEALRDIPEADQPAFLRELLAVELECRLRFGERPKAEEYVSRFPQQAELIDVVIGEVQQVHISYAAAAVATQAGSALQPGLVLGNCSSGDVSEHIDPIDTPTAMETPSVIRQGIHDDESAGDAKTIEYPNHLANVRIVRQIGAGGMGYVLEAEDTQLHRRVALKVMKRGVAEHPRARERFLREARAVASLHGDFVIPIYQVAESDGIPFIAMPLLQGETLDARLKRIALFPIPELLRTAREIAIGPAGLTLLA